MAQNDLLKRLLDAGVQFTQLTQQRAEALVRDFVSAGEVQAEQAQSAVAELVDRSRKNTEKLLEVVRGEVQSQVEAFNDVSREAFARLEKQVSELRAQLAAGRSHVQKTVAKTVPAAKKAAQKAEATTKAAKKSAKKTAKKATKKTAKATKAAKASKATKKSAGKNAGANGAAPAG
jgi:polyhydroxyalkanoate synthesis regulator phasin